MKQFQYTRALTQQGAIEAIAKPGTKIIAGGTNLIDLMKRGVTAPDKLVDINHLPLKNIAATKTGLHIGALA
ncbi:MAG: xanthine dehydrogenase YagS FAD-binding subunit, partial [Mucilaginibacter sp.]|nr:xanthine dehydrogenase YagS FAD-binding subunit [Mucilaginibacter sp.]